MRGCSGAKAECRRACASSDSSRRDREERKGSGEGQVRWPRNIQSQRFSSWLRYGRRDAQQGGEGGWLCEWVLRACVREERQCHSSRYDEGEGGTRTYRHLHALAHTHTCTHAHTHTRRQPPCYAYCTSQTCEGCRTRSTDSSRPCRCAYEYAHLFLSKRLQTCVHVLMLTSRCAVPLAEVCVV